MFTRQGEEAVEINLLAINGSAAKSKRTHALLALALAGAQQANPEILLEWVDLSEVTLDFCDGRPLETYSLATQEVLKKIAWADAYVIGTPMYRAMLTGALKNLFDLIPKEYVQGKAAGLIATGGSDHHYLGLEIGMRTILAFFQMHSLPGILYATNKGFADGEVVDGKLREDAHRIGRETVELAMATDRKSLGPSLY